MTQRSGLLGVVVSIVIAACSAGTLPPAATQLPANTQPAVSAAASLPAPSEDAVWTYGHAPAIEPALVLQPDVVLLGGGGAAVREASADGLTWTIDRAAPGADQLVVGSVMFATSRALGRVVQIRDEADTRVILLAPVDLTEIVRDGDISFDDAIDPDTLAFQEIPDLPGMLSEPDGGLDPAPASPSADNPMALAVALPPLRLQPSANAAATLPVARRGRSCLDVTVGQWNAKPCREKGKLSVGIEYKGSGLKAGITVGFRVDNLRLRTSLKIRNSTLSGTTAVLEGVKGVDVSIAAGTANGASDNTKIKVEVPIEMNYPIPPTPATGGLPLTAKLEFKFIVETALGGKNSTLTTSGAWNLDGPIGIENGATQVPTFSLAQSILDNMGGLPIGVSGIVVATKVKVQVGLGIPAASAGPYVAVTAAVGVTHGSALGSPLATCRNATLDIKGATGFGISVTTSVVHNLLKRLGINKIKTELETPFKIYSASQTQPDVALCRGSDT